MRLFKRIIALILCLCMVSQQAGFAQGVGQIDLASHFARMQESVFPERFRPVHLRYLAFDEAADSFKLLLDKGDSPLPRPPHKGEGIGQGDIPLPLWEGPGKGEIEEETDKLMRYFQIGLVLPNSTFWVNLCPNAPDNIIEDKLAQTDIGRIMLEADVQLKKDTAAFTSPDNPEGKEYWGKLYKKAGELFGTEQVEIPTFTRPWIVPGEIILRETRDDGRGKREEGRGKNDGRTTDDGRRATDKSAYIYKATLKVMLEEDYVETVGAGSKPALQARAGLEPAPTIGGQADPRYKVLNEYSSELLRQLIIPKIIKAVNSAKRYADLRQVYYSLILAQWFKDRNRSVVRPSSLAPRPSSLERMDSGNLSGLTSTEAWSKSAYFTAYQKSFKEGEYQKNETIYTPYGAVVRRYVSGGLSLNGVMSAAVMSGGLLEGKTAGSPVNSEQILEYNPKDSREYVFSEEESSSAISVDRKNRSHLDRQKSLRDRIFELESESRNVKVDVFPDENVWKVHGLESKGKSRRDSILINGFADVHNNRVFISGDAREKDRYRALVHSSYKLKKWRAYIDEQGITNYHAWIKENRPVYEEQELRINSEADRFVDKLIPSLGLTFKSREDVAVAFDILENFKDDIDQAVRYDGPKEVRESLVADLIVQIKEKINQGLAQQLSIQAPDSTKRSLLSKFGQKTKAFADSVFNFNKRHPVLGTALTIGVVLVIWWLLPFIFDAAALDSPDSGLDISNGGSSDIDALNIQPAITREQAGIMLAQKEYVSLMSLLENVKDEQWTSEIKEECVKGIMSQRILLELVLDFQGSIKHYPWAGAYLETIARILLEASPEEVCNHADTIKDYPWGSDIVKEAVLKVSNTSPYVIFDNLDKFQDYPWFLDVFVGLFEQHAQNWIGFILSRADELQKYPALAQKVHLLAVELRKDNPLGLLEYANNIIGYSWASELVYRALQETINKSQFPDLGDIFAELENYSWFPDALKIIIRKIIDGPSEGLTDIMNQMSKIIQYVKDEEILRMVEEVTRRYPVGGRILFLEEIKDLKWADNLLREDLEFLKENYLIALAYMDKCVDFPWASDYYKELVESLLSRDPVSIIVNSSNIDIYPWGRPLIIRACEDLAKESPRGMYRLLRFLNFSIEKSPETPSLNLVMDIKNSFESESLVSERVFSLSHMMVNEGLCFVEALAITQDKSRYFKALIEIDKAPEHIERGLVEEQLYMAALELVHAVIDAQERGQPQEQRSLVENMDSSMIYTLMVHGADEIVLVGYNFLFNTLLERMRLEGISGSILLKQVDHKLFRTFIRINASSGRLNEFLDTMNNDESASVLSEFISGIEGEKDKVVQASVIADTLWSMVGRDRELLLGTLQGLLKNEYERIKSAGAKEEDIKLYGLLVGMFGEERIFDDEWFKMLSEEFGGFNLSGIPEDRLFPQGVQIQQYYFYNDEDGQASFDNFVSQYPQGSGWQREEYGSYVHLISPEIKGRSIEIYANRPQAVDEGKQLISELLKGRNLVPTVVVHRGHSFHVNKTIAELSESVVLVFLGSCGGYNQLMSVSDKAPMAHIFSTKRTGTMWVNDPVLKTLNIYMLNKGFVEWDSFSKTLGEGITKKADFRSYVFPNKNMAVIFFNAWRKVRESLEQNQSQPQGESRFEDVSPDREGLVIDENYSGRRLIESLVLLATLDGQRQELEKEPVSQQREHELKMILAKIRKSQKEIIELAAAASPLSEDGLINQNNGVLEGEKASSFIASVAGGESRPYFYRLRQVYYTLILAQWFKERVGARSPRPETSIKAAIETGGFIHGKSAGSPVNSEQTLEYNPKDSREYVLSEQESSSAIRADRKNRSHLDRQMSLRDRILEFESKSRKVKVDVFPDENVWQIQGLELKGKSRRDSILINGFADVHHNRIFISGDAREKDQIRSLAHSIYKLKKWRAYIDEQGITNYHAWIKENRPVYEEQELRINSEADKFVNELMPSLGLTFKNREHIAYAFEVLDIFKGDIDQAVKYDGTKEVKESLVTDLLAQIKEKINQNLAQEQSVQAPDSTKSSLLSKFGQKTKAFADLVLNFNKRHPVLGTALTIGVVLVIWWLLPFIFSVEADDDPADASIATDDEADLLIQDKVLLGELNADRQQLLNLLSSQHSKISSKDRVSVILDNQGVSEEDAVQRLRDYAWVYQQFYNDKKTHDDYYYKAAQRCYQMAIKQTKDYAIANQIRLSMASFYRDAYNKTKNNYNKGRPNFIINFDRAVRLIEYVEKDTNEFKDDCLKTKADLYCDLYSDPNIEHYPELKQNDALKAVEILLQASNLNYPGGDKYCLVLAKLSLKTSNTRISIESSEKIIAAYPNSEYLQETLSVLHYWYTNGTQEEQENIDQFWAKASNDGSKITFQLAAGLGEFYTLRYLLGGNLEDQAMAKSFYQKSLSLPVKSSKDIDMGKRITLVLEHWQGANEITENFIEDLVSNRQWVPIANRIASYKAAIVFCGRYLPQVQLGDYYWELAQLYGLVPGEQAQKQRQDCLIKLEGTDTPRIKTDVLQYQARGYFLDGEDKKALDSYLEAYKIIKKNNLGDGTSVCLAVAEINIKLNRDREAMKYYREAINLNRNDKTSLKAVYQIAICVAMNRTSSDKEAVKYLTGILGRAPTNEELEFLWKEFLSNANTSASNSIKLEYYGKIFEVTSNPQDYISKMTSLISGSAEKMAFLSGMYERNKNKSRSGEILYAIAKISESDKDYARAAEYYWQEVVRNDFEYFSRNISAGSHWSDIEERLIRIKGLYEKAGDNSSLEQFYTQIIEQLSKYPEEKVFRVHLEREFAKHKVNVSVVSDPGISASFRQECEKSLLEFEGREIKRGRLTWDSELVHKAVTEELPDLFDRFINFMGSDFGIILDESPPKFILSTSLADDYGSVNTVGISYLDSIGVDLNYLIYLVSNNPQLVFEAKRVIVHELLHYYEKLSGIPVQEGHIDLLSVLIVSQIYPDQAINSKSASAGYPLASYNWGLIAYLSAFAQGEPVDRVVFEGARSVTAARFLQRDNLEQLFTDKFGKEFLSDIKVILDPAAYIGFDEREKDVARGRYSPIFERLVEFKRMASIYHLANNLGIDLSPADKFLGGILNENKWRGYNLESILVIEEYKEITANLEKLAIGPHIARLGQLKLLLSFFSQKSDADNSLLLEQMKEAAVPGNEEIIYNLIAQCLWAYSNISFWGYVEGGVSGDFKAHKDWILNMVNLYTELYPKRHTMELMWMKGQVLYYVGEFSNAVNEFENIKNSLPDFMFGLDCAIFPVNGYSIELNIADSAFRAINDSSAPYTIEERINFSHKAINSYRKYIEIIDKITAQQEMNIKGSVLIGMQEARKDAMRRLRIAQKALKKMESVPLDDNIQQQGRGGSSAVTLDAAMEEALKEAEKAATGPASSSAIIPEQASGIQFSSSILHNGFKAQLNGKDVHVRGVPAVPRNIGNYLKALDARTQEGNRVIPAVSRVYLPLTHLDIAATRGSGEIVLAEKGIDRLPLVTLEGLRQAAKENKFELVELRTREDYLKAGGELAIAPVRFFDVMIQVNQIIFVSDWVGPNVEEFIAVNSGNEELLYNMGSGLAKSLYALHKSGLIAGDTHLGQFVVKGQAEGVLRIDLLNIYSLEEAGDENIDIEIREIIRGFVRYQAKSAYEGFTAPYRNLLGESSQGASSVIPADDLKTTGAISASSPAVNQLSPKAQGIENLLKAEHYQIFDVDMMQLDSKDSREVLGKSLVNALSNGQALRINFSKIGESSNTRIYDKARGVIWTLASFTSEVEGLEINFSFKLAFATFALLKNAFVHGNKLDLNAQIYLYIDRDNSRLKVYDCALEIVDQDDYAQKMEIAKEAGLHGFGSGLEEITGQQGWSYLRDTVIEEMTAAKIGTVAIASYLKPQIGKTNKTLPDDSSASPLNQDPQEQPSNPISGASSVVTSEVLKSEVKGLDYSDETAESFANMFLELTHVPGREALEDWQGKLSLAEGEYNAGKLSQAELIKIQARLAKIELEVVKSFVGKVREKINPGTVRGRGFDLKSIALNQKAQCSGYTQTVYIISASLGLKFYPVNVLELIDRKLRIDESHLAGYIDLSDGTTVQVDLMAPEHMVSEPFRKGEHIQFVDESKSWEIPDKDSNPFYLHKRVLLLNKNSLIADRYVHEAGFLTMDNRYDEAFAFLKKAVEKDGKYFSAYANLATLYYGSGQYDQALASINQAIDLMPGIPISLCSRANILTELGLYEQANEDYKSAVDSNPVSAVLHFNYGVMLLLRAGEAKKSSPELMAEYLEQSILEFDRAVEIDSGLWDAFCNRGIAYAELGRMFNDADAIKKAGIDFKQALDLNPKEILPLVTSIYSVYGIYITVSSAVGETKSTLLNNPFGMISPAIQPFLLGDIKPGNSQTPGDSSTSSPAVEKSDAISPTTESGSNQLGGIDLRSLPASSIQHQGSSIQPFDFAQGKHQSSSPLVPLTSVELQQFNRQWREFENMVANRCIPSSQRLNEFAVFCARCSDFTKQKEKLLTLISDILRIQEEEVVSTEAGLKDLLVKLEPVS